MSDADRAWFNDRVQALRSEVGRVLVGQGAVLDQVITCLVADGHALLEGVPGLGKTLLVRTLATCLGLDWRRIQFTPVFFSATMALYSKQKYDNPNQQFV